MECAASVKSIPSGFADDLDFIVFNHEPQWHLLRLFRGASRRVFFALHYTRLYRKEGSWESARASVDLRLANSEWTADMLEQEIGSRPLVIPGGINKSHFHPVEVEKEYPILCVGDRRPWKGTATIEQAAAILGLPLERFGPKGLPQEALAHEFAKAEVFVVGSEFEGFGQPGLEALACGVPLVTTANGGSADYAVDGETALVVPPDEPMLMAQAIDRLRQDQDLRSRLVENGLALVQEQFDWDRGARRLEQVLYEAHSRPPKATNGFRPNQRGTAPAPVLSVVIPAWDQLHYTQRCVESLRRNTDVPYEIVLVDNGSGWEAAAYAAAAGDQTILNPTNRGFAAAMNQGLAAAKGEYVAFVNNDTRFPPMWASRLLQSLQDEQAGIVVPAVTAAGNPRTVRSEPGEEPEVVPPFCDPPSGVVFVMRTEVARSLGGWSEEYRIAASEDVDLAFTTWVNGLDIIFDQRVLVEHVAKGTAASKLPDWRALWDENRARFLEKWSSPSLDVPRLERCTPSQWHRNLRTAQSVAMWMNRYFAARAS